MKITAVDVLLVMLLSIFPASQQENAGDLAMVKDLIIEMVEGVEKLMEGETDEQADPTVPDTVITKSGRCQKYLTFEECRAFASRENLHFLRDDNRKYAPGCVFKVIIYSSHPRVRTNVAWRKNYAKGNEPACAHDMNNRCICAKKRNNERNYCPKFVIGDGSGGTQQKLEWRDYSGDLLVQTPKSCVDACKKLRLTDPTVNGVTVSSGTQGFYCLCEKGMTGYVQTYRHKTCFLDNLGICPKWTKGDGSGGTEEKVKGKSLTGENCVRECKLRMRKNPNINGVTVLKNRAAGCWCEIRMTGVNAESESYETCLIELKNVLVPLRNAHLSSKYNSYGCFGASKCVAGWAIDGRMNTAAVTHDTKGVKSWSAEITKYVKIEKILVFIPKWALEEGKYSKFKVETRLNPGDNWKACRSSRCPNRDECYIPQGSFNPYVVTCRKPISAKYVKLSVDSNDNMYLLEVKVYGTVLE